MEKEKKVRSKKKEKKVEEASDEQDSNSVNELKKWLTKDEKETVKSANMINVNNINISKLKEEIVTNELLNNNNVDDVSLGLIKDKTIKKRESEFQRKKYDYVLSPMRVDPFSDKSPLPEDRTYTDVMLEINKEAKKSKGLSKVEANEGKKRKNRWGDTEVEETARKKEKKEDSGSKWEDGEREGGKEGGTNETLSFGNMPTPAPSKWSDTPFVYNTSSTKKTKVSRWDKTSSVDSGTQVTKTSETPMLNTPLVKLNNDMSNHLISNASGAPLLATPRLGITGTPFLSALTPIPGLTTIPSDSFIKMKIKNEMYVRNRPLTDEDLDELLPSEGYEIVKPPEEYEAIRANKLKTLFKHTTPTTPLLGTNRGVTTQSGSNGIAGAASSGTVFPQKIGNETSLPGTPYPGTTPYLNTPFYELPGISATATIEERNMYEAIAAQAPTVEITNTQLLNELKYVQLKNEDYVYFNKLFQNVNEEDLSQDEVKERKFMLLLLKIKNGTPSVRRTALRAITEKAKELGPNILFNLILPLMMQNTLEDQERHLLVKVIDRILYKLDDLVRPYVHKILVVIEPLLIDEDYYARVEGREIISNLAKAAGLATMIGTMRPDIDHPDEYVRNTTARAFAVVASALGIPSLILFLKAVCQSKRSWEARHTGIKIVQQIAILMGCAVLPHLKQLVNIIAHGLHDEQQKVRTITALALAALAEASAPYGIEAFDSVLRPLWKGITEYRGKVLAAFLKAIGLIIPLMDSYHANYYTKEVMVILINEFNSPDEEMKKIVLKCVKQCIQTEGVDKEYIQQEIVNPFFEKFWIMRNASDKRNFNLIVDTTVEIANKVGAAAVISKIVDDLKDPSEQYRKMVLQTLQNVVKNLGVDDIDQKLEEQIIDGILYAFQEQTSEDYFVLLNAFDVIVNKLKYRMKPYLPQIAGIIRWRLNTPLPKVRQQSADLITKIAKLMKLCDENQMLGHLALYLYEYLGEEYPEVLGSIIRALKTIVVVLGVSNMTPPIKDLLPRITPILKNRHEKVQEHVIDLIGIIADKGGDLVSPKEWDRICFDLVELLKSNKKLIRRATIQAFGYIARTIGPFEVLTVLLNNLKVQERQLRICTTVAIAIVADTCLPYSVLTALMNEYRTQDLNVQNGVLKALSFMFEYIGEISKDYIYSVITLLENALTDRDMVHRQIATWACKHLALGCFGLNREDALMHLLNYVWPNIFETSPHLIQAVIDAIDGFRVALGPAIILQYLLQGLFHPSRKVREIYWRIYNNVYIGHQDSLVPIYPPFDKMKDSNFVRDELLYTL